MKQLDLKGKTVAELDKLLVETKNTMIENTRSLAAGELPNPRVITHGRRDIARIHTAMTQARNQEVAPSKGDA